MTPQPSGIAESLRKVQTLGPFFEVALGEDGKAWRGMVELSDGAVMAERIAATRAWLVDTNGSPVEDRVAASTMQMALAARLMSPALASATLGGWVPDFALAGVRWQPTPSGPVSLALPHPTGRRCDSGEEVAEAIHDLVIEPAIRPLIESTMAVVPMSPQVLWGNVSSVLAGAGVMISALRPRLVERARLLIDAVLSRPPLAGTGGFDVAGSFQRQTCCLYYRLPRGVLCGDCVLNTPGT